MKTTILSVLFAGIIFASCQKTIADKPQASSPTPPDDIVAIDSSNCTVTVDDNISWYNDDPSGGYVFDSCTNEWVHVWGRIHNRTVDYFQDSVKQTTAGETDYQNVQGIGNVSGQKYAYKYQAKSIAYAEWNGQEFEEKVNFHHAHSKLIPAINGTSFVTDSYWYFVADDAGNLIINKQHYDFGSCH